MAGARVNEQAGRGRLVRAAKHSGAHSSRDHTCRVKSLFPGVQITGSCARRGRRRRGRRASVWPERRLLVCTGDICLLKNSVTYADICLVGGDMRNVADVADFVLLFIENCMRKINGIH